MRRDAKACSFDSPEIQAIDILAGDLGIRTDVEDVDSLFPVPQVRNRLRNDALRDPCLSKPNLVGDEEAIDTVGIEIKAAIGVIDRRALKIAQRPADLFRVRLWLRIIVATPPERSRSASREN